MTEKLSGFFENFMKKEPIFLDKHALQSNYTPKDVPYREDQINQRFKNYIDEFVICNECKKPDTQLITFEGVKYKKCEVCGARAPVKAI